MGTVIAWGILTGLPIMAAWALFYRFTNTFAHVRPSSALFYAEVRRLAGEFEANKSSDTAEGLKAARLAIHGLRDKALALGALNNRDAYVIVGKWLTDYRETTEG